MELQPLLDVKYIIKPMQIIIMFINIMIQLR